MILFIIVKGLINYLNYCLFQFVFQHAAVALSALINGMYELNTVAIVRYCRAKNAPPKLGFLAPHIKQDYEVFGLFISIVT